MKIPGLLHGCLLSLLIFTVSLKAAPLQGDSLEIGSGNDFSNLSRVGAIGVWNSALDGDFVFFVGYSNALDSAWYSLIMGWSNQGNIDTSLCVGSWNDITSMYSLVVGDFNTGSVNTGAVIGTNNAIYGMWQYAFGRGLLSQSNYSWEVPTTLLGQYNKSDPSYSGPPPLLLVGNGTGAATNERSNALEVYMDGKMKIGNSLEVSAPTYASGSIGKIVIQPSLGGSSLTIDGRAVVAANASGNVGLGNSSPTERIDITGNQKLSGFLKFPSTSGNPDEGKIGSALFLPGLNMVGTNSDSTFRKLAFWGQITQAQNDGTNTWAGTNYFSGDVGVGTSTPQARLHAYNAATATSAGSEVLRIGAVYSGSLAGSGGYVNFSDATNTALGQIRSTLEANGQVGLSFSTYNGGLAERVRIANSGAVGVGTAIPRNGLEIACKDGDGATSLRIGGVTAGTTTVAIGAETSRHQILFSTWRDSVPNAVGAKIAAINNNAGQASNATVQSTDLAFFTSTGASGPDSTTQKMIIKADGSVLIAKRQGDIKMGAFGNPNSGD